MLKENVTDCFIINFNNNDKNLKYQWMILLHQPNKYAQVDKKSRLSFRVATR